MNQHNYVKRVNQEGVNLWQCQAPDCQDQGPLRELMGRECAHVTTPEEAEQNLLDAIEGR